MPFTMLERADKRPVERRPGEIRAFVTARNERHRLPCFLEHHRKLGVDRFFFADNRSTDGTLKYLLEQKDCHVFSASGNHFAENVSPPNWLNALLNTHGSDGWCLTLDCDELFVFPFCESLHLKDLCRHLDVKQFEALAAVMIDMYPAGPIAQVRHARDRHFLDACSKFDPHPGWIMPSDLTPGWQMFGGVRERVFWRGQPAENLPPCISKVPLIKWKRGMRYVAATHLHSGARTADFRAALLHFKFLEGFALSSRDQLHSSKSITEKTLSEREIYLATLAQTPGLSLANSSSLTYCGPEQLINTGWMTTSPDFRKFATDTVNSTARTCMDANEMPVSTFG